MRARSASEEGDGFFQQGGDTPSSPMGGASRSRGYSSDSVTCRPGWDDRHHLLFARENIRHPKGQRDYFDRPRDLRICVPHGHDGISTPYELRPSMHWLKYRESPKMSRIRSLSGGSRARGDSADSQSGFVEGSPTRSAASPTRSASAPSPSQAARARAQTGGSTMGSPTASQRGLDVHHHIHMASEDCHVGVGSPPGSPAKPHFQKTASWLLEPEKLAPEKKRENKFQSTHYSEKHGTMKYKQKKLAQVPWNNRWHLNPSNFGQSIHQHYREYFDNPSRMYTSSGEDWRHMYGDGCELINQRTPGQPYVKPVYGWHSLRLQDKVGLMHGRTM